MPRPTAAAIAALAILAVVRIGIALPDNDLLIEPDSRWIHNMLVTDLKCEAALKHPPRVIVMGTSRAYMLGAKRITDRLGIPRSDVAVLASPGADFLFMEIVMQRHPELFRNVELVIFDVLPMQVTELHSERGEYFMRFASLNRRLNARGLVSKAANLGNLLVPTTARAQDPYQWRTGFARLRMTPSERAEYIRTFPMTSFAEWPTIAERMHQARSASEEIPEIASILFPDKQLMPNQLAALENAADMTAESCKLVGVWLPFRDDMDYYLKSTPATVSSRKVFEDAIGTVAHPRLSFRWYESPADLEFAPEDYDVDGAHFSPSGFDKLGQAYATIIRDRLDLKVNEP